MSFTTATYPGTGARNTEAFHYSQAVKVGSIIQTSGQGGWDTEGNIVADTTAQIAKAMENVLTALQAVDASVTWRNVYSIKSYHTDLDATFDVMVEQMRRLMPDHKPIWTCVQIGKLGIEGMAIEIAVEAAV
jgi:enamine deaminase RidA (YjgF/YER057c/UK114 family)